MMRRVDPLNAVESPNSVAARGATGKESAYRISSTLLEEVTVNELSTGQPKSTFVTVREEQAGRTSAMTVASDNSVRVRANGLSPW